MEYGSELSNLAKQTALARMNLEEDATAQQVAGEVALRKQGKEVQKAKVVFDLIDQLRGDNAHLVTEQMRTQF